MYKKLFIIILFLIFSMLNSFALDENAILKNYLENAFSKIRENSPIISTPQAIVVEIKILPDGNILESKIITSSGNEEFDNGVLEAVKKSAPYGKIPQEINAAYVGAQYSFGYQKKIITFENEKNNYNLSQNNSGDIQLSNNGKINSKPINYKYVNKSEENNIAITYNNPNDIFDLNEYFNKIYDKLYTSIKNTKRMLGQAKFTAYLKILKDGTLADCKMLNSTGNSKLDNTLLEIIKESSPFEALPSSFPAGYVEYQFRGNTYLITR